MTGGGGGAMLAWLMYGRAEDMEVVQLVRDAGRTPIVAQDAELAAISTEGGIPAAKC